MENRVFGESAALCWVLTVLMIDAITWATRQATFPVSGDQCLS
jgi:hypothetical protein